MHIISNQQFLLLLLIAIFAAALQPLPNNYIEQSPIIISPEIYDRSLVIFSPNQISVVWFYVYERKFTYLPSMFYPQSQKVINVPQAIVAMAFSPVGDALFITSCDWDLDINQTTYLFFKFDIDQGFIIQPMIKFGNVTLPNFLPFVYTELRALSNYSNPIDGRVALGVGNYIIDVTLRGPLKPYTRIYNLSSYCNKTVSIYDMDYMLLNQKSDNCILYISTNQMFFMYNSKEWTITVINSQPSDGVGSLMKGQLVLLSQQSNRYTYIYRYLNKSINQVDHFTNFTIRSNQFSSDENYFVAQNFNYQARSSTIRVYQVTKEQPGLLMQTKYQLQVIFERYFSMGKLLKITRKANDIYIQNKTYYLNTTIIHRWSRCGDGKYNSNGQCFNCSSNCKTCHQTADKCTTCLEGSIYKLETCGTCVAQFIGCLECNLTECMRCNQTANFYLQPVNFKCTCVNGSYSISKGKQCRYCKDIIVGCLNCIDSKNCLQCNKDGNFVKNSTSGKCDCKTNYSLKQNKTCQLCDDYVKNCTECTWTNGKGLCKKCINQFYPSADNTTCFNCWKISPGCIQCNDSSCIQCDSSRFYNTTLVNDSCVCQNGFVEQNATCLKCKTNGCSFCSDPDHCQKCYVNKNFNSEPVDGVCTCTNGTFSNQEKTACFYCSDKMFGCLKCETLSKCTQCDASKNLELNQQQNGCVCIEKYVLLNNTCKQCSGFIDFCQTCSEKQNTIKCQSCKTDFIYDSSTNKCKCPDGYTINSEKNCEKDKEKDEQNDLTMYWIVGGVSVILIVLIGVFCYKKIKKCRQRRQSKQKLELNSTQQIDYQQTQHKNQTLMTGSMISSTFRQK